MGKGRFASLTLAILGTIMNITATLPEQIESAVILDNDKIEVHTFTAQQDE